MLKLVLIAALMAYFLSSFGFWMYLFTKKEIGTKIGFSFFGLGFLIQLIYIGIKDFQEKTFAVATQQELPFFLAFLIGVVYYGLSIKYKKKLKDFGSIFAPINVFLIAMTLPNVGEQAQVYKNFWFYAHVILSMVAYAFIIASTVVAVIYILTHRDLKRKKLDSFFVSKFSSSLALLEEVEYKSTVLAFITLSLALIASSIWSSVYLGKHWIWDPKQIALSLLWIFYGFLLHIRVIKHEKGIKAAYLTIAGGVFAFIVYWFVKHPVY
ncbi:MAG: cytochrome c biogenesis protein CcsA [Aquificae bacterium]|nr:cytochrome c biogenesis protein CcsA [Aquificota bacterium]